MAAANPSAVVNSASEMPGATARRLAEPATPSAVKASMMPLHLGNQPAHGAIGSLDERAFPEGAGNPLRGSFHDFECHDHLFESRISQLSTGYVEWQSSM